VSADEAVRVLVVDDHPVWRRALTRDLGDAGIEVVGEAGSVGEAAATARATRPTVVLLDLQLPDGHGADAIASFADLDPVPHVLVLSASGESTDVLAAVRAGACGYLTKSAQPEALVSAVRATHLGEPVFTPSLAGLVLGEFRRLSHDPGPERPLLTDRETEVLRLVSQGLNSKDIAARLVLSHRTVQNHTQSVLTKLHLHNRVELTRYALEHGLDQQ
jgi:DNA-binding NarL/FixJ family response regulator